MARISRAFMGFKALLTPVCIVAAVCLAVAVCRSAGLAYARLTRTSLSWPLCFLVGAALLSLTMLVLGSAGAYSLPAILALGVCAVALGVWLGAFERPELVRPPWWVVLILTAYGYLYLTNAIAPEVSPDGVAYHVELPRRYWAAGGVVPILTSVYAQMPQAMEMLYAFVLPLGGPSAAGLLHLVFLIVLAALIYEQARNWLPVLLVFCSPVVGIDAISAYNDVALAAATLGVFVLLRHWQQERHGGLLAAASLLAGFCFGLKYTGVLAFVLVLVMARSAWRDFRLWLPAALLALPWLIKNAWFTGNPLAPFANGWFANPVFDRVLEAGYLANLRWPGTVPELLWEVITRGQVTAGLLGPVFLLAPLALCSLRQSRARWWLAAGALLAVPLAANAGTRFLIPSLPFVALALHAALPFRLLLPLALLHTLLSWPLALDWYTPQWAWRLREAPLAAALRLEPEREFLARRLEGFGALPLPADGQGRVLSLSQFHDAYSPLPLLTATASREGRDLATAIWMASQPAKVAASRVRYWFAAQPVRALRLRKNGGEAVAISRLTPYDLLQPVTHTRSWRTHASSNGFFSHRALDGSLFTRWYSATALGAPVSFELHFGEAVMLNRLDVDLASTEVLPQMQLEALGVDHRWRLVRSEWEQAADPAPPGDPRREALQILHRHGVGFVLVQNRDHVHEIRAFDEAFEVEGFLYERVRDSGSARLYRLIPVIGSGVAKSIER